MYQVITKSLKMNKIYNIIYFKINYMYQRYLFLISQDILIIDDVARYLLQHVSLYYGSLNDYTIVEIANLQQLKHYLSNTLNNTSINFTQGFSDKLTIGKLKHQLADKSVKWQMPWLRPDNYLAEEDDSCSIYYLLQLGKRIADNFIFDVCKYNACKSLKIILDQGANINIQDNIGFTPLDRACKNNSFDCIRLLLDYGAKTCKLVNL